MPAPLPTHSHKNTTPEYPTKIQIGENQISDQDTKPSQAAATFVAVTFASLTFIKSAAMSADSSVPYIQHLQAAWSSLMTEPEAHLGKNVEAHRITFVIYKWEDYLRNALSLYVEFLDKSTHN